LFYLIDIVVQAGRPRWDARAVTMGHFQMKLRPAFGIVAVALCVLGCAGGGSGGGGSIVQTPPSNSNSNSNPNPPSSSAADAFRTAEYNRMGALDQIHAADAYALGYTGKGVIVGVVDFNFDFSSSEVNFHSASVGPNAQMMALYQAQTGQAPTTDPHGQAVASIIAAKKNNVGIQGVAFNAQILAVDFFSDINETQMTQNGVLYHVSDPWTYITSHGARIINTSYGYEASDIITNPPAVREAYVTQPPGQAVLNGALLVASAGNAGGANPSQSNIDIINSLPAATLNNGPGAFIIAGAVDSNNQIASFSDRAGAYMNYYMVAPGVNLFFPWTGGALFQGSGTSFSAPLISGAAAVILERWPFLTARQLADILLQSATPLGDPAIYGHGLLNLYAALQPNGVTTFAVAGGGAPVVAMSATVLSPAFGDAAAFRSALSHVMMLDSFGRDFPVDVSGMVATRPSIPDLFSIMEQRLGWHSTSLAVGTDTRFAFDLQRNPEDGIVPIEGDGGPQRIFPHQTVFRLSGADGGMGWTLGRGLSLSDALERRAADDPFSAASLTGAFSPMAQLGTGSFATISLPSASTIGLAFGVYYSENQGQTDQLRTPYHSENEAVAIKLDRYIRGSQFGVEFGALSETGGLFGSLAAGGLAMAERSTTAWTTATAETALDDQWSLKGSLSLVASGATHPQASLITEIGPVYGTSFALGLAGANVFNDRDGLSFSFSQPLRAETAPVMLSYGIGRDWSNGAVIMGQTQTSLVPTGREFDLETTYRLPLGDWAAESNLAYRIEPDHVHGQRAIVTLLSLSRTF
jgi:hypothetical protein